MRDRSRAAEQSGSAARFCVVFPKGDERLKLHRLFVIMMIEINRILSVKEAAI